MMIVYDVLIIEDESNIAEFHSQLLLDSPNFNPVGVAGSVKEAKSMLTIFKPDLVILDNYLPDGKGIDLMKVMTASENPPNVIFVTAASDMETVQKAIRMGAFDYLLKPISYARLSDSLERFLKYMSTVKSTDSINQRFVDIMMNYQSKNNGALETLPKGIDQLTVDKIKSLFIDESVQHTAESLVEAAEISKTTARRYLEYCAISGFLKADINHGKRGRPERIYSKKINH
ncbi:response regulator [Vibrio sp. HN007]|uniref:response regulator n=1 Tax=Vibrio iocasae TaxID=3098914 RepID=UPI0035D51B8E